MSAARPPESQRKSPFATLIGTGEIVPVSHRRKTLTSVGTPFPALASIDAAPASAPSSSKLPPPLPLWGSTLTAFPPPPSQAPTSSSAVVARAALESIPLDDVAKFRSWSPRRSLLVLGIVALVMAAIALVASRSGSDSADESSTHGGRLPKVPSTAAAPAVATGERAAASEDHEPSAPATRSGTEPSTAAPASNPKELRPAKAPSPSKPVMKDYGI
jgi:hypothetical protein